MRRPATLLVSSAAVAAVVAFFHDLPAAFADACASTSHASTGAAGGDVSSAIQILGPVVTVGLISVAVRRLKKK